MLNLVFVTPGNKVYFTVPDKEILNRVISDYEDLAKRVTKDQDQILYGDEGVNHRSMIRVSQVIGYYVIEDKKDPQLERLVTAQTKMAEAISKQVTEGDDWKA